MYIYIWIVSIFWTAVTRQNIVSSIQQNEFIQYNLLSIFFVIPYHLLAPFPCLHYINASHLQKFKHSPITMRATSPSLEWSLYHPLNPWNQSRHRSNGAISISNSGMRRGLAPWHKGGIEHTFGLFKETARRGFEYAEEAWWNHPFRTATFERQPDVHPHVRRTRLSHSHAKFIHSGIASCPIKNSPWSQSLTWSHGNPLPQPLLRR